MKEYNVAVVGIGMVGAKMLEVLRERSFPAKSYKVLATRKRTETIAGHDYDEHPELKGDFRLRKMRALYKQGQIEPMFAVYKELLTGGGEVTPNAKLEAVITVVGFYRSQGQLDKALAEGKIGLALKNPHPGLLGKLKTILKQIEN